jgi:hypothetical protein
VLASKNNKNNFIYFIIFSMLIDKLQGTAWLKKVNL